MVFKLRLTDFALEDLDEIVAYYVREASTEIAARWLQGIESTTESLTDIPERYGFAPENEDTDFEVRQAHYKSHRVLFTVEGDTVAVLRIYHGARDSLKPDQIT